MLWEPLLAHADVAAAAIAAAALFLAHRRDRARMRYQRSLLFSRCLSLFETYRVTQESLAYPILRGGYRGYSVRLEPIVDDMAWRKIPSLWLKVTVLDFHPERGVLDFLVRPRGVEFYSPGGELPHRLRTPENWPQDSLLSTDDPDAMPEIAAVAPHLSLFDDPRMKELLITPKGVRLVRQIRQADRAHYLVLRQAKFAGEAVEPEWVQALLDAAIAVSRSLCAPELRMPELQMPELLQMSEPQQLKVA